LEAIYFVFTWILVQMHYYYYSLFVHVNGGKMTVSLDTFYKIKSEIAYSKFESFDFPVENFHMTEMTQIL
jgi:hypothetical protein